MLKQESQTCLVVGEDGSIVIPAEITQQSGLKPGSKVVMHSNWGQLLLVNPRYQELIEAFINETHQLAGSLKETDKVWDGMTLEEYFSLSDEKRAVLWNNAYGEACDALDKTEEIDIESECGSTG
jgi:bifunctional DNA-binding transcriptional regulator/antitoxin component of YhaV-PrlF toxin-antitoxin module